MNFLKHFLAGISLATMVVSPVAHGAQAKKSQKELIGQYLKSTGLTSKKRMTVREYWRMVRHVYPKDLQAKMDTWVAYNRDELMPEIQAGTFKDSQGREQVRLTLKKDGQVTNLTFVGGDEQFLKINGVGFSKKELYKFDGVVDKFYKKDSAFKKQFDSQKPSPALRKNVALSASDFAKLSRGQKVQYLLDARRALIAASQVIEKSSKTARLETSEPSYASLLWETLLGEPAYAVRAGQRCIIAGYISVYGGKSMSCGGASEGSENLKRQMTVYGASCSSSAGAGAVPCNPLVYGFKSGTEAHCVPKAKVIRATEECNRAAPIDNHKNVKKIIDSFVKKDGKNLDLDIDDKLSVKSDDFEFLQEQYFKDLNGLLSEANELCDTDSEFSKVQKSRPDQESACRELKKRALTLQKRASENNVGVVVPPGDLPGPQSCDMANGFKWDGKACVCADGQKTGQDENGTPRCEDDDKGAVAAVGDTSGVEAAGVKEGPSWWDRNKNWIIPVGIGALALGLFWWLTKEDKGNTTPVYTPPATPPLPSQPVCNSGQVLVNGVCSTPVVEPPANPCPAPNALINGVCVPPEVTPPPPPVSEGGSGTPESGYSGGVLNKGAR